jgi:antitoxin ParD1/3/4
MSLANIDDIYQLLYCVHSNSDLIMASTINLSLTDELRAFIDSHCGDQGLYATPSEFLRDLLREKKERIEAARIRDGVLEGYRDILSGHSVEFTGSIRSALTEARKREKSGW